MVGILGEELFSDPLLLANNLGIWGGDVGKSFKSLIISVNKALGR